LIGTRPARRIDCKEGIPFQVDEALQPAMRAAALRLKREMGTGLEIISEGASTFTIRNVVGSLEIGGVLFQVTPKTTPADDWIRAVLDLLIGSDRIGAASDRAAGLSANRRDLADILAAIYADRLERALRRDGPILQMEQTSAEFGYLKGKLQSSAWLRTAAWKPHRFPVTYGLLSPDNVFSRSLALTAQLLAAAASTVTVRARLLRLAQELRPSMPEVRAVPPSATAAPLPSQWSAYHAAWSVACAVLNRRTLLGARGTLAGVSIAILAWPLLERLLQRGLQAAARIASASGRSITVLPKRSVPLLVQPRGIAAGERSVEPDGELIEGGRTIATFEAKYADFVPGSKDWPRRDDYFQALCTASACGAPVSILVYPGHFEPACWRVPSMGGTPGHLIIMGLGLFSYRAGQGDDELGHRILSLLDMKAEAWDSATRNDAVAA
jgi:hypothetical protein